MSSAPVTGRRPREAPPARELVLDLLDALRREPEDAWGRDVVDAPAARELAREARRASRRELRGRFLRGRRFPRDARPSRDDVVGDVEENPGRFTRAGEPGLYLAREPETVAAECPPEEGRPRLLLVAFDLDLPDVAVLDVARDLSEEAPTMHALLAESERAPAGDGAAADVPHAPTRLLGLVLRRVGVDAVLYPSVRRRGLDLALLGESALRVAAAGPDEGPFEAP